jgi:hypothetical protein
MWSRPQQAAFLIQLWSSIRDAIAGQPADWANDLREKTPPDDAFENQDPAFSGIHSLLNTDQGVRGVLHASNDVTFVLVNELRLEDWRRDREKDATDLDEVSASIHEINVEHRRIREFLTSLSREIAKFDWRSGGTPGLTPPVRNQQLVYRTGTGYREVRRQLLLLLRESADQRIAAAAGAVVSVLKYDTP